MNTEHSPDAAREFESLHASEDTHATMTHSQSQHTAVQCHPNGPVTESTLATHTRGES